MSLPFLISGLLDAALVIGISWSMPRRFRNALTSIEEKNSGWAGYYRASIGRLLGGKGGLDEALALLHYVALHLLTPLLGFGLFLHSDANFLTAIVAIIVSIQLVQRLYPGSSEDEEDLSESES